MEAIALNVPRVTVRLREQPIRFLVANKLLCLRVVDQLATQFEGDIADNGQGNDSEGGVDVGERLFPALNAIEPILTMPRGRITLPRHFVEVNPGRRRRILLGLSFNFGPSIPTIK